MSETPIERRSKPRLSCLCPAVVRGVTLQGQRFETAATLINLSASGLYLRMQQSMQQGMKLAVCFRWSQAAPERIATPALVTQGVVVRTEAHADGTCGLGIRLLRYRLL